MLYWKDDGDIDRHELYQVNPNPIEEGNEITSDNPELAEELLNRLLAHLYLVGAERRN